MIIFNHFASIQVWEMFNWLQYSSFDTPSSCWFYPKEIIEIRNTLYTVEEMNKWSQQSFRNIKCQKVKRSDHANCQSSAEIICIQRFLFNCTRWPLSSSGYVILTLPWAPSSASRGIIATCTCADRAGLRPFSPGRRVDRSPRNTDSQLWRNHWQERI